MGKFDKNLNATSKAMKKFHFFPTLSEIIYSLRDRRSKEKPERRARKEKGERVPLLTFSLASGLAPKFPFLSLSNAFHAG